MDEPDAYGSTCPTITYIEDIQPDPPEWRLAAAKAELAETDYYALKFIDGELSAEEYEPHRARRAELRQRVRDLEPLAAAGARGGD